MIIKQSSLAFIFLCAVCCTTKPTEESPVPSTLSFDPSHSDPAAVELLDSIASAGGGQKAWEETRYISWNADGDREIFWDKKTGNVRVDSKADQMICIFNSNSDDGKVRANGSEITDQDELSKKLAAVKQQWQKDVHDLFLAFNLKQSGYSFVYLGEETLASGIKANVVEVERDSTADHLSPIYKIFVDQKDSHILQIGYLNPAAPDSLGDIISFDNYKRYGDLVLSADRSGGKGPRDVKIGSTLAENIFEEF